MNLFKERCIALRKEGYSIIEIMKVTGRAKSSIHTHIKDIPLSDKRIQQYKIAAGKRIRKFSLARKGKSIRTFRPFAVWSTNAVLLVAHFLFDGEIARVRCVYNNRSEALIERVARLMREWYDFEPKRYQNQLTGVYRISYHNVVLGAYIQKKSVELLRLVKKMSLDLKLEFIRAFFDDEGCIDYRPDENRRSVRGYQKNVRTLSLVQALLADFGIDARIVKPNEVVIVGKENLKRFEREINFSLGVYMNGNRSNSRWKKHVEKRELLRRAIESFKN
ncbi:MAG: LAGLIDADG family homing endonuclease [bacterium]|nr:LAGLIDADG family homing endonuclease [bacterium]